MSETLSPAARVDDPVGHGWGMIGMIGGAVLGAVVGGALIAATVVTGGAAAVAVAGLVAGGALAGGQLARGLQTVMGASNPTTGLLVHGSPNVRINGHAAVRALPDYVGSCSGLFSTHHRTKPKVRVAEGSATVRINGYPAGRVTSRLECAATVTQGSPDVRIGGPTVAVLAIHDNEATWTQVAAVVGLVALGGGLVAAAAAGAVVFGGFVVVGAGFFGLNEGLGWIGDRLGPGWRDVLQGGAGIAAIVVAVPRGARALQTEAETGAAQAAARSAMRERVLGNIEESRAARAASRFGEPPIGQPRAAAVPVGRTAAPRVELPRSVAGAGEPAPGDVNYMRTNDPFALNAARRPDVDPNGHFDFIAHGNSSQVQIVRPDGQAVLVDHRIAARLIEQNPGYREGQPVRLLSCSTGEGSGSFAQNLANRLGVPVQAPNDVLWAFRDGSMQVSAMRRVYDPGTGLWVSVPVQPPTGTFLTFLPGNR